jgi:hypothetical protein
MNNKLLYLTPLLCTLALDCSAQSSLLTHHCLPQDSIIYAKESAVFHPDKYYEAFDARYDVPLERDQNVITINGTISSTNSAGVYWNNTKSLGSNNGLGVLQDYREPDRPPAIIVADMTSYYNNDCKKSVYEPHLFIIDMMVIPPYVTKDYMPIYRLYDVTGLTIEKREKYIYAFSGYSYEENQWPGRPRYVTYLYNSKTHSLTQEQDPAPEPETPE